MKSDFEWRSGDETHSLQESTISISTKSVRAPRIIFILLVGILVGLGAWLLFRNVGQYVAATEVDAAEDARQSLDLFVQAQETADLELVAGHLSGRDANWAQTQISLAEAGLLLDRSPFGLVLLHESPGQEDVVELSPDLAQVAITRLFDYETEGGEAVSLAHDFVFRRGSDRWLLSPPDEAYWGRDQETRGRYITAVFPEAHSDIHRKLATDLEGAISLACQDTSGGCMDDLHIVVIFSRDPEVMLQWLGPDMPRAIDGKIVVPAISLLGVPVNESAYRIMLRIYSSRIVEAAVTK